MKALIISAVIFCAYWIVGINDENTKLKEIIAGDTWCEIKYQQSTAWQQCRLLNNKELNRQVAVIKH